jgi:parvulin-like peptidyl-prolyl isomerase
MFKGRMGALTAGRGRRMALVVGAVAVAAGALWAFRTDLLPWAFAQQPAPQAPAELPGPAAGPQAQAGRESEIAKRVVAYIYTNEAITRQELGEYLIARYGHEKLPALLNRKLLEYACAQKGIQVSTAEVELAFAQEMRGLKLDEKAFAQTIQARYRKSLLEWKEDVIRPRLLMTRLCAIRVNVSNEDVRKAYEAQFGEKLECRMILWPPTPDGERDARAKFGHLRDSELAFAHEAKHQPTSALASSGGKLKPFGRYVMAPELEQEAFKLRPGEVSALIVTPQGIVLIKCDKRHPADTTVSLEAVHTRLYQEVYERKVHAEMATAFEALRKQANPQVLLPHEPLPPGTPLPPPSQVVGMHHGSEPVTREDLAEYLLVRHGAERLELFVNRKLIERECRAKQIVVTDQEVEAALTEDLKALKTDRAQFKKDVLAKMGRNLYEWREDVVRPKLMLTRLCAGRVHCTEEDLRKCFEAHYGEKLECRMILWPTDQAKFALGEYARIRDSEEDFLRAAHQQATPSLAAADGMLPAFGRYSLGDENLEKEAFRLQPGEVTPLVGTAQGQVVLRCVRRLPPNTTVRPEAVREKLTKEIIDRKTQLEMQVVFKEVYDRANPRLMLKREDRRHDLKAEARQLLGPPPAPQAGQQVPKR